jgi:hypothetical protein
LLLLKLARFTTIKSEKTSFQKCFWDCPKYLTRQDRDENATIYPACKMRILALGTIASALRGNLSPRTVLTGKLAAILPIQQEVHTNKRGMV